MYALAMRKTFERREVQLLHWLIASPSRHKKPVSALGPADPERELAALSEPALSLRARVCRSYFPVSVRSPVPTVAVLSNTSKVSLPSSASTTTLSPGFSDPSSTTSEPYKALEPCGPWSGTFSQLLHVGPVDARGGLPQVELAGRKVHLHLLSGRLDEPGVVEYVLDLVGGCEAADVLFLHHVP